MSIRVSISEFASCMGYCQFRIINTFHLKLKPRISLAQIKGNKVHGELERIDSLIPREEVTEEQLSDSSFDLDIPREVLKVFIKRENKNEFLYVGRIDKAERKDGNIYIIDDKTTRMAHPVYFDNILQTSCYCEGFTSVFSEMIKFDKIFFKIVQRDLNGNVIQEVLNEFDSDVKNVLHSNFEIFEKIVNKEIQPNHHGNAKKCSKCGFECQWKV
jgi:hypothetical protein